MDPCVILFDEKDRLYFEEAKRELKKQDYQLMNVNECAIISPEDYQISAKEAGFHAPEDVRVGDLLMDDEEKKSHITLVKLNRLLAQVNERTILVITYNDLYRRLNMSDLVYHYCSIESFIKIVEGKSLKFSDIKKSNDYREIELLWQYYSEYIEKNSNNPCVKSSLKHFKDEQMNVTDFLVCCFSNTKDSLHLWNCYANKGVAITIPNSVTSIGGYVFYGCDHLEYIYFDGNCPERTGTYQVFPNINAVAYYPCNNATYTQFAKDNMGSLLNWTKIHALSDMVTENHVDIKTPRLIQFNYSSADFAA